MKTLKDTGPFRARYFYLLPLFLLGGCVGLAAGALAVDAVVGGVGIYQRHEDRQAQKDQTEEIKQLREEIARHRQAIPR